MDWTPWVLFMVAGLLAMVAQSRYYDELARRGEGVSSDQAIAAQIRDRPGRLVQTVTAETLRRLRALGTRRQAAETERLRMIALIAVIATLACFAWTIYSLLV